MANAVGQGREAALVVHRFLMGTPPPIRCWPSEKTLRSVPKAWPAEGEAHVVRFEEMFNPEYFEKRPRKEGLCATEISFAERNAGLNGSAASEAERCFHCGHCHKCGKCVEDCPGLILVMTDRGPEVRYA